MYGVPDPWQPYTAAVREYLAAGVRGDSTGLVRRSAKAEPVAWVLDAARRYPHAVAAWAHDLATNTGLRRGDTVLVSLWADSVLGCSPYSSVSALLLDHPAPPRLLAVSSPCIPPPPRPDSLVRLYHNFDSQLAHSERRVVADSAQWVETWPFIRDYAIEKLPRVDFAKHLVVIVTLGGRASAGSDIAVDSTAVTRSGRLIFVRVTNNDGCVTGGKVTHPLDVVLVPRTRLPVRFVEDTVPVRC
jgi:hypothetical protein